MKIFELIQPLNVDSKFLKWKFEFTGPNYIFELILYAM
jgi:hypothetical protein